jgi:hypothetical protein
MNWNGKDTSQSPTLGRLISMDLMQYAQLIALPAVWLQRLRKRRRKRGNHQNIGVEKARVWQQLLMMLSIMRWNNDRRLINCAVMFVLRLYVLI